MTAAGARLGSIVIWACLLLAAPVAAAQTVATYHGNAERSGNFVMPGLNWANAGALRLAAGFAPSFPGNLYAQPLYWRPAGAVSGMLIVVSESDVVSAIDAATGRTLWSRTLGTPVPLAEFSCGNIDPLGITGTPVIDQQTGTLYVDAMVREPSDFRAVAGRRHCPTRLAGRCRAGFASPRAAVRSACAEPAGGPRADGRHCLCRLRRLLWRLRRLPWLGRRREGD
jgi:hypothetical protein